jgi:hypothetical protein
VSNPKEFEERIVCMTITLPAKQERQLRSACPGRGDRSKLIRELITEHFDKTERINA